MTTSSISHSTHSVSVGADVMSADGKRLGIVKEALQDRFLVDVRWAPDYWLGSETIDSADSEIVQLIITKDAVGPAKLRKEVSGPGLGRDAEDFDGPSPVNRPPPSI
jgi:hypothetical protein